MEFERLGADPFLVSYALVDPRRRVVTTAVSRRSAIRTRAATDAAPEPSAASTLPGVRDASHRQSAVCKGRAIKGRDREAA